MEDVSWHGRGGGGDGMDDDDHEGDAMMAMARSSRGMSGHGDFKGNLNATPNGRIIPNLTFNKGGKSRQM